MEEVWKDIRGYEGLYQVSNVGRVKRVKTGRILKGIFSGYGYVQVDLSKEGCTSKKLIHRLVAQAFIPNVDNKLEVNHINEDKTNNRVDNLEWVTRKENNNHGTHNEKVSKSKSTPIIATHIKTGDSKEFYGASECARQLGLNPARISEVINGKRNQTKGYTFKYKEV